MKLSAACLLAVLATGCAGSPLRISLMDPHELAAQPTTALALAYHSVGADDVRAELERREAFTLAEWALIDAGQVQVGMSVEALYASMGTGKENVSVGPSGRHIQHCYGTPPYSRMYVYTENGVVTSWQK